MKLNLTGLLLIFLILFACCSKNTGEEPDINTKPELILLDLVLGGSVFETTLGDDAIYLRRNLPFGTESVSVKKVTMSGNNTSSVKEGDVLQVADNPIVITISNSRSGDTKTYSLVLETKSYRSEVEKHGLLRTKGSSIVNRNEDTVSFAGNSFFWSNSGWGGEKFYNSMVVDWLKLDWETTIVRAAMGVEDPGGYIQSPEANRSKVRTIVDAAIANGLYVIIDWHSHHAEDYQDKAVEFFSEMASLYGDYDNVIYEIYNEPLKITWGSVLKPYAETVIAAIRLADPDNLIIVGTPEWSQQVDKPAADPITSYENIAYSLHFYSVNHKQWLRDRASAAIESGLPLFVTEWGSIGYTQDDPETVKWMEWCKKNRISHCNWAVNDKAEPWSVVQTGASPTGGWTELTAAGYLARSIIREWD